MNLKEINGHKKVADDKGSDEVTLEYVNQEGSYQVTFKKVEEGYQAIKANYYHLIDTPLDATPGYYTPEEGEIITDEQFEELQAFIGETSSGEAQAWWEDLDEEDKEYYAADLIEEGFDINSLTQEQIQQLFYTFTI